MRADGQKSHLGSRGGTCEIHKGFVGKGASMPNLRDGADNRGEAWAQVEKQDVFRKGCIWLLEVRPQKTLDPPHKKGLGSQDSREVRHWGLGEELEAPRWLLEAQGTDQGNRQPRPWHLKQRGPPRAVAGPSRQEVLSSMPLPSLRWCGSLSPGARAAPGAQPHTASRSPALDPGEPFFPSKGLKPGLCTELYSGLPLSRQERGMTPRSWC